MLLLMKFVMIRIHLIYTFVHVINYDVPHNIVIIVSNNMFAAMIEEWTLLKYYKALLIKYTQIIKPFC